MEPFYHRMLALAQHWTAQCPRTGTWILAHSGHRGTTLWTLAADGTVCGRRHGHVQEWQFFGRESS